MKKNKFAVALFSVIIGLIAYQPANHNVSGNSFGAPVVNGRGYTGSPSDNRACNVSGCHTGSLNTGPGTVEINTDVPIDGYKAGERYNVEVKITQSGRSKFGFQITAEDNANQKSGRFIAGSQTRAPSDFFITQGTSAASSSGSGGKTWSFTWDAPNQPGDGPITLYAAFNGANNNGNSSGDNIYTTSLTLSENIISGFGKSPSWSELSLFPNPVNQEVYLHFPFTLIDVSYSYSIFDLSGRTLKKGLIKFDGGVDRPKIDVSTLLPGTYQLIISGSDKHFTSKLVKS